METFALLRRWFGRPGEAIAAIAAVAVFSAGCGGAAKPADQSPAAKACAADLSNLAAAYKLARHAGLGLGPNLYLAIHAPTRGQRAAALQRFEDTCKNVS